MLKRKNTIAELEDNALKEYAGIVFNEIPFAIKINIRGNPKNNNFMSEYGKILQTILPTIPNTYTNNRQIKTLWLGPNEWLIVDENLNNNNIDIISKLEKNLNQKDSSITDVSENRTIIRIRCKKLFTLLSKFLVLDLDKNLTNESSVAQTLFVKVPIILVRNTSNNEENTEIDLYMNRSHANYVYSLLVDGTKNLDF